jgi:hypothetical protein
MNYNDSSKTKIGKINSALKPLQPSGAMASLPRAEGIGVVFVVTKTQTCYLSAVYFIK